MYEIKIFEGHNVEVIELNGRVLFNPYNVGECLELTDSAVRMAIGKMNNKQVFKLTNSIVNEVDFRKIHNTGENFSHGKWCVQACFQIPQRKCRTFSGLGNR